MTRELRYHCKLMLAERGGDILTDEVIPFPPTLGPGEFYDFLADRFGEPTEDAVADTEEFGRLGIGWVYEAPDDPGGVRELIATPMIDDPDEEGELMTFFVYQERLRREFTDEMTANGVEVQTVHHPRRRDLDT
ncbi:MAG: hypothetical protein M3Y35_11435 [Actinomycetota bacterium]|nr:hypothetical protein [Actinomycetota bacterium]